MSLAIVLLPEWRRCVASAVTNAGQLAAWCSRCDRLPATKAGFAESLRGAFEWPGQALSMAALSRQADVGDAGDGAWLRADPAHVRADMATARMLACGQLGLTPAECAELAHDLAPLFGDAGLRFDAPVPERWYVRGQPGSTFPDGRSPDEVLGDDLRLHLPEGAAGKRWRLLFNESQVLLHNHPVNQRRARRGVVAVNSLWFWGAGALPGFVRSPLAGVFSARAEVRGLAGVAGLPVVGEGLETWLAGSSAGDSMCLIDLAEQRDAELEASLGVVHAWLVGRGTRELELRFASGERQRVRARQRWRFWCRAGTLDSCSP